MNITSIRKFFIIVLSGYFGALVLVIAGAAISGKLTRDHIGIALLFIGSAIFILGFLFMGTTNRGDGMAKSPRIGNDAYFREWRKHERPVELVTWAIILAAALIAGTGYVLLHFINLG
jgi:hypothetical protein